MWYLNGATTFGLVNSKAKNLSYQQRQITFPLGRFVCVCVCNLCTQPIKTKAIAWKNKIGMSLQVNCVVNCY